MTSSNIVPGTQSVGPNVQPGCEPEISPAVAEQLKAIGGDRERTLRLIMALWDCATHCVEPLKYHETSEKLQEALAHEMSQAPKQQAARAVDGEVKTISNKELDWQSYKLYRVQFDSTGTPIPDPDWPAGTRFVKGTTSQGVSFFELFENQDAALDVDTTDPTRDRISHPQLKDDGDRQVLVYYANERYRFGPDIIDENNQNGRQFSPLLRFNYAEHALMGNQALLAFDGSTSSAKDIKFTLKNGLGLTYGEITALGGDFFGTSTPIMRGKTFEEQCDLFKKAYATLAEAGGGFTSAVKIGKILSDEMKEIGQATDDGEKTADTLKLYKQLKESSKALSDEDKGLDDATREPGRPSYLALAQLNIDHFGRSAVIAYNAGHFCAMQKAKEGDLDTAYTMNAFADHYLGDSFSSGHFRTPREVLHGGDQDVQKAIDMIIRIAVQKSTTEMVEQIMLEILKPWSSLTKTLLQLAPDLCAKYMHDEDSVLGLRVTNLRGDHWRAYGDAKLFDPGNIRNAAYMREALQRSVDEVWDAYKNFKNKDIPRPETKPADMYQVWKIAPSGEEPNSNHQPLFDTAGSRRSTWTNPKATGRSKNGQLFDNYELWAIQFTQSDYFKNLK